MDKTRAITEIKIANEFLYNTKLPNLLYYFEHIEDIQYGMIEQIVAEYQLKQ